MIETDKESFLSTCFDTAMVMLLIVGMIHSCVGVVEFCRNLVVYFDYSRLKSEYETKLAELPACRRQIVPGSFDMSDVVFGDTSRLGRGGAR